MDQHRGNDAAQANMADLLKALKKARDDFIKACVDKGDSEQVADSKWKAFLESSQSLRKLCASARVRSVICAKARGQSRQH